jgi:hypothetical protein
MDLRDSVIRTVSYFDLFDFPLTRAEIGRWLFLGEPSAGSRPPRHSRTDQAIEELAAAGKLQEAGGFVFRPGRTDLPALRAARYRLSCRKLRRARRWARFFAALPGVRLVLVSNTAAYGNARDESDIDLAAVSAPGMIWRTRFLCAVLPALLGLRPQPDSSRDKLCLSFFVAEDALDLSPLALPADTHFAFWIAQMLPLAGAPESYDRFLAANGWTAGAGPRLLARGAFAPPGPAIARLLSWLACLPADFMENWQRKKFPPALAEAERRGDGSVVVSPAVLKFHVTDRRREYNDKLERHLHDFT